MDTKFTEEMKRRFTKNTVVRLDRMDDMQAPPAGSIGRVIYVDDAAQIHVKWENGSTLALIPGIDEFHIVRGKEA